MYIHDIMRRWRRSRGIASTEDEAVDNLHADIKKFEASSWVDAILLHMAKFVDENPNSDDPSLAIPEAAIETWLSLDPEKQTYVFLYLLGGCYGLLKPPDEPVPASL